MIKQFYFQQLNLTRHLFQYSSNVLFDLIDRTLSGATTSEQTGPGSNGNKGISSIPQNSSITGAVPSDSLMSYQDTRPSGS